jgi:hypothetical protein
VKSQDAGNRSRSLLWAITLEWRRDDKGRAGPPNGVAFVWERVTRVRAGVDRVDGLVTHTGRRVDARWYIDASRTARLFSRAMHIPVTKYGRDKVCLWTYFETPPLHEGTAFFVDNDDVYLRWAWDIPISPTCTSVGFIAPADAVRQRRRAGESLATILSEELRHYPRFAELLDAQPPANVFQSL